MRVWTPDTPLVWLLRSVQEVGPMTRRRTGGSGMRTHPLADDDYRRATKRLAAINAADEVDDE